MNELTNIGLDPAFAEVYFGDVIGHPFHGNQYAGGSSLLQRVKGVAKEAMRTAYHAGKGAIVGGIVKANEKIGERMSLGYGEDPIYTGAAVGIAHGGAVGAISGLKEVKLRRQEAKEASSAIEEHAKGLQSAIGEHASAMAHGDAEKIKAAKDKIDQHKSAIAEHADKLKLATSFFSEVDMDDEADFDAGGTVKPVAPVAPVSVPALSVPKPVRAPKLPRLTIQRPIKAPVIPVNKIGRPPTGRPIGRPSTRFSADLESLGLDPDFIDAVAMFEDERSPIEIHVHTEGYGDDASKNTIPPPDNNPLASAPDPFANQTGLAPAPGSAQMHPAILHAIGVAQQAAATALQHASNAMTAAQQIKPQTGPLDDVDDDEEDDDQNLPMLTTVPDRRQTKFSMTEERAKELLAATGFGNSILCSGGVDRSVLFYGTHEGAMNRWHGGPESTAAQNLSDMAKSRSGTSTIRTGEFGKLADTAHQQSSQGMHKEAAASHFAIAKKLSDMAASKRKNESPERAKSLEKTAALYRNAGAAHLAAHGKQSGNG